KKRHRNNVSSISTCLAAFKQLPRLEVGSDIFFIATRLKAKKSNREIFIGLVLQFDWLKTHSLADVSGYLTAQLKVAAKFKKKTVILITIATCVDYFLKYVVKNSQRTL
ncbi:hypothetical protein S83_041138, partial [Arachis hypogaea]